MQTYKCSNTEEQTVLTIKQLDPVGIQLDCSWHTAGLQLTSSLIARRLLFSAAVNLCRLKYTFCGASSIYSLNAATTERMPETSTATAEEDA